MTHTFIETSKELEYAVSFLSETTEFAIDLEFDKNYHRYGFNLCLVQIYADSNCYLIDPLSPHLDIEILFPLLEDETIQKVTFAFGEDLRLLHTLGCFPKNIYDISIATRLLNYPPCSLSNLITGVLEIDLGKSSQKSNWYKRPLTEDQTRYAAEDVLYLLKLKNIFVKEASEKNITEWIAEENAIMDELNFSDEDSNTVLKEKDKKGLTEHEWHLFKNLMIFRETTAQKINRPGFKIVKKDYLKELAQNPGKLKNWHLKKGIYKSLKSREAIENLRNILNESAKESASLGFSKTEPAMKPMDKEQYAAYEKERARVSKMKRLFFNPIKEKLTEQYGKGTASFIFSNRIISDLVSNENRQLEGYKRDIIVELSEELEFNPDDILNAIN